MASKTRISDIDDVMEMMELFKLLQISYKGRKLDLENMKEQAKEKIQEQISSSKGATDFSVITKAKQADMLKRDKLEDIYSVVNDCLEQMGDDGISTLNTFFQNRDISKLFKEQRDRLNKRDYHLLVAGECSAGKSSLINLILGEELLPHHALNTTSTICEVKYGEKRNLVVHYRYDRDQQMKRPPTTITLETEEEEGSGKSYQEQLTRFVCQDQEDENKGSDILKVEIFWPHKLLKEGVIIIDSPGIGESDEMDQVLMNYLPKAFAFIYVIDVSHAGGMQKYLKEMLMKILEKVQSLEGGTERCKTLAECSLFVCNKWDQVARSEQEKVKTYVVQELKKCWPDANLNSQVVYMSILKATEIQRYGGVTEEFNNLLLSLQQMIRRAIGIRLYNHWQWLDFVLRNIFQVAQFYTREMQSSHQETRKRMNSIERRMAKIEAQEQEIRKEMEVKLKEKTELLFGELKKNIQSPEFVEKFCTWTTCDMPPRRDTWGETKKHCVKAIEYRLKEMLIEWENKNRFCAKTHKQLVEEFLTRLNLLEEELHHVIKAIHGTENEDSDNINASNSITMQAKILVGATSPVWIPVGVVSLIISMPVLAVVALSGKVSEKMKLDKYRKDPLAYFEKRSKKFLASLKDEDVSKYAEWQMEKTTEVLTSYIDSIPTLIEAHRKMVSHLLSENRSQEEVLKLYTPIQQKSLEMRKNMTPLGIEFCPVTVDKCDLEWKKDMESCLGEGEFSRVYRAKLKNAGNATKEDSNDFKQVAVKVFRKPFDDLNLRIYIDDEMNIRHLDHKNVAKFFGAIKADVSHRSNEHKFVFVTELCPANLRSIIFQNKSKTPAKAFNTNEAIKAFLKWAMEIADGLNYIHTRRIVHRHLKLDNILVKKDNTVMIGDTGIVGQFLETEKSIIYLAPEVLADLSNRTKKADIYSYGIMLWEMWYGTQAFTELMPLDKTTFQHHIAKGTRPSKNDMKISLPRIETIMECCWTSHASERPSAKECYDAFQDIFESCSNSDDAFNGLNWTMSM